VKRAWICVLLAACAVPRGMPPAQVAPRIDPGPGQGVLIVDVTDGPTRVEADDGPSCTTPCALQLPLGPRDLKLRFRDQYGDDLVERARPLVMPEPHVLRRSLHRFEVLHPTRLTIARTMFYVGAALMAGSLIAWPFVKDSEAGRLADRSVLGAGGGLFLLSLPLHVGTVRHIVGAETQFPLRAPGD
jgi:hypothetical protein